MKLNDFDFELPKRLIAQRPAVPRDHSRLLIYDRNRRTINEDRFFNLSRYLPAKTALVLNDSKVEKARLKINNTEIFILDTINPYTIKALVRPGRKFKTGKNTTLALNNSALVVRTIDVSSEGIRTLQLNIAVDDTKLMPFRLTPLPPYIKPDESLSQHYQTVYAKPIGSKAAPTAGLHFTPKLIESLAKNHDIVKLTLHVGLGTFAPIKQENISRQKLHSEEFFLSESAAKKLNSANTVTAVGTTTLRALESLDKPFSAINSTTDIFITPGYHFKNVDHLVTNFHLPKSSLLMLVAAFIDSVDEMHRIYRHAVSNDYRFYSFGDAMLII